MDTQIITVKKKEWTLNCINKIPFSFCFIFCLVFDLTNLKLWVKRFFRTGELAIIARTSRKGLGEVESIKYSCFERKFQESFRSWLRAQES